jgi:iron complex transport system permease protein
MIDKFTMKSNFFGIIVSLAYLSFRIKESFVAREPIENAIDEYHQSTAISNFVKLIFITLLLILIIFAMNNGAMDSKIKDVISILLNKNISDYPQSTVTIIREIRLPRILTACLVGSALAISGVIFQAILQNPLADPFTIGISSGAAFGASLALLINMIFAIYVPITLFALIFAIITLFIVILISHRGGGLESSNLIIAGIIISSIFSAGISMIKMVAGENVGAIVFWLMGNIGAMKWSDVGVLFIVTLICFVIAMYFSSDLNIMSLGNRTALSLGVNVKKTRLIYLLLASSLTAVSVAYCGIIGFIGLVVPHLLRFSLKSDNRHLLPLSALLGALLLLASDTFTRTVFASEVPVGVFTTLFGGPFFIYIFLHRRNKSYE